ncbi:MAG: hypothetical protein Q4F25_07285 [Eubacteriales bacterium]|nr:hypothetical protein [Eubacteriales bacterium]
MDEDTLAVQDAYLQERIRENGIVELSDFPVVPGVNVSKKRRPDFVQSGKIAYNKLVYICGIIIPDIIDTGKEEVINA